MSHTTDHYVSDVEDQAFCGEKIKQREWGERQTAFLCGWREKVTCKNCLNKLKKEDEQQKKLDEYRKKFEKEVDWDKIKDYDLGYVTAIMNMLGEFMDGECEDCLFSGVEEIHAPDFVYPEYGLTCSLERCWIKEVKDIIRSVK